MRGWFDAFRNNGGPTLYNFHNRTSAAVDITLITILSIFLTIYVGFLFILPGIRKEKCTTFFAVTLSLFVGTTIFVALYGLNWHVGSSEVVHTYGAYSKKRINGTLGIFIGLDQFNVTLQGNSITSLGYDINFNEQFMLQTSDKMRSAYKEALKRGLPYPILTAAEYFSLGLEGLAWGRQYRAAGYFASIMLWASLMTWLLMNIMVVVVPCYGALLMALCGILLLSTACGYFIMLPDPPLLMHLEGSVIEFSLGWCFWLVFVTGCVSLFMGVVTTVIEIIFPHSFLTILEVNYDTPYDRHIIIEDSHGRRFQKKRLSNVTKLEEPPGAGLKILGGLSSKPKEDGNFEQQWHYPYSYQNFSLNRSFTDDSVAATDVSIVMSPIKKNISRLNIRIPENSAMW